MLNHIPLAVKLIATAAIAFAVSLPIVAPQTSTTLEETGHPAIIAVKFHADWCGFCKSMGNVFEELQAKYDTQPVLYVTLDQTRSFNRDQSRYLAGELGLVDMWTENGGKTGFILLIDAKTRSVVNRLTHDQTLKQMGATLMQAVATASGT